MTTWKESSTPQKQPAAKVAVSAASYIDHTIIIINIIIFFFFISSVFIINFSNQASADKNFSLKENFEKCVPKT